MNLESRQEVEVYLERLNQASPIARRQIARWGPSGEDSLRVQAVRMPARFAEHGVFLGRSRATFAIDVESRREAPANTPYSVGIILEGAMRVTGACGDHVVQAGQGVIVNPCEIERTWLEPGTHMVEFALPKASMLSLGAELAPGNLTGLPRFAPVLSQSLAERLLVTAQEAARLIPAEAEGQGLSDVMFRRWIELIGLTLLNEQSVQNSLHTRLTQANPPPAALRRAMDFIEANAAADILLSDVANAASVSVSSLGRLFKRHLGQSPAALMRDLRLDRVRQALLCDSGESVRELAQRWGFQSASQFSQAYRRRFGEKPSDTRLRA